MARVVKEYDERLKEFLGVARQLFYSKGYEATSIQDIIKAVGVAKGTFYHYFDSKSDLLETLIEHMYQDLIAVIEPITEDKTLSPLQQLEAIFAQSNNWKLDKRDFMVRMLRTLYMDENVLLRDKMRRMSTKTVPLLLSLVIEEGIKNKSFKARYPLATAKVILKLSQGISEIFADALLDDDLDAIKLAQLKEEIIVYNQSIEQILGLDAGELTLISLDTIDEWLN